MKSNTGKFTLMTNDKFKKVMKPSCVVKMDNIVDKFEEFVVVGYNEETYTSNLVSNADALTLGQALQLIQLKFREAMDQLDDEERKEVMEVLTGDYNPRGAGSGR